MKKLMLFFIFLFLGITTVNAEDISGYGKEFLKSFEVATLGSEGKNYVGDTRTTRKAIISGDKKYYIFCLDPTKPNPEPGSTITQGEILDEYPGIGYIVTNQYSEYTGEEALDKNYYVTQTAIWWYIDRINGIKDSDECDAYDENAKCKLSLSFKSKTDNSYVKAAKGLMEEALDAVPSRTSLISR